MSLDRLRREGETFMQELSLEFYQSLSGLKGEAQIQRIYEQHGALFSGDALDVAREMFEGSDVASDDRGRGDVKIFDGADRGSHEFFRRVGTFWSSFSVLMAPCGR